MNLLKSLSAVALAAVAVAAAHPAAAHPAAAQTSTITLTNGNFSQTDPDTRNRNDNVTGFTGTQQYGFAYGSHGSPVSLYINGGTVYQFLGTTGAAGEMLTLTGNYTNGGARAGVEFSTAAPTSGNELASGSVLASEDLSAGGALAPLTFTTTVANQGIYLDLVGPDITVGGQYGPQINYSNFSLTDVPAAPAAVPEASSSISLGLLLMLALGGFAVARKRSSLAA